MRIESKERRAKKKIRIKKKISGTSEKPRISVYRSLTQIYAQIIDDNNNQCKQCLLDINHHLEYYHNLD